MENTKYVHVSEAITSAILERENVRPIFLHRNPDNSFTAVFDDEPAPHVRQQITDADETIVLLEPELVDERHPNIDPRMPATIRFAFTAEPTDYS